MAKTKISTLNLRIEPGIKEAVREAAAREHRSVANMIEVNSGTNRTLHGDY
jgi:hypothetical protein